MTEAIGGNAAQQLLSIVERIERLNQEKKALQDDTKQIFSEAAGAGFNAKALRKVISDRAKDRAELDEFEQLVATYWSAIGGR